MPDPQTYNERELLLRIAEGDNGAFDLMFRSYWDHVFSVALMMTKSPDLADDIGQEVFFAFLRDREKMTEIRNLKGFLHTSVKFLVHKRLRRLRVEEAYTQYMSGKVFVQPLYASPEKAIDMKDLQKTLQKGIESLPLQQRRAFKLSREEGLSHEAISIKMGVSKKTVKDYIVRAIAFLRNYLALHGDIALYLIWAISLFQK